MTYISHPDQHGHWDVQDIAALLHERDALRAELATCRRERDEWARKWHAVRAELAELKYPGMKGVVYANNALAGKGEGEK